MKDSLQTIEQLNIRLKGYHRAFRGRFLLLQRKDLRDEEFILWECSYSVLVDWDKKHNTYGTFSHTWVEIGMLLGWSDSKVSRASQELFKKGFWKRENTRIRVCGYNLFEKLAELTKEKGIIDLITYVAYSQFKPTNVRARNSELQADTSKENRSNQAQLDANMQLNDSKERLSLSSNVPYFNQGGSMVRTEEEYQEIFNSGQFPTMTIDDMKWIDKNIAS